MIHVSIEGIVRTSEETAKLVETIKTICDQQGYLFEFQQQKGEIYLCPLGVIEILIENYYFIAKTNSALVGAGYHAAVCELFENIQKASSVYLSIDDECSYLDDHDFERIQENYFIPYMGQLMAGFAQMKDEDEATYGWDNKSYLPLSKEKTVITPFGYIQASDCRGLSIDKACQTYYVWNQLEKNAQFFLNCALVSLWCDCLFENSIFDEKAKSIASSICLSLEKAHELDPNLPLPVDEYQQLCKLLNRPNRIFDVDQYPKGMIGYRKESVFYVYGNWFIYFDGNALQSFDHHTMILEQRDEETVSLRVKITGYKNHEKMDFAYRYLNTYNALDHLDFENEGIHVKAVLHELKDDSHLLYLQAQCIKDKEMLMINVECADMESYRKAVGMLENIQMIPHERGEVNVAI